MSSDIQNIVSIVTGVITLVILILVYFLDRHRQQEAWVKEYRELHQAFWNDPAMARVRYWVNYDRAYLNLKPILHKRREIAHGRVSPGELLESEYICLDDLDKFYNLVQEIDALNKHLGVNFKQGLWKKLYFDYWVKRPFDQEMIEKRLELCWYVWHFYEQLLGPEFVVDLEKIGEVEVESTLANSSATASPVDAAQPSPLQG